MAKSPAHRFGQIIGDTLEAAVGPILQAVASDVGMFLDGKGARPVRAPKKKVSWKDACGNTHDLDYVIEDGGAANVIGVPRAFIEIAWRRYTKHSRNKAQEIQGAIKPLAEKYRDQNPFLGAVLAGVFTQGSLEQLRSQGFVVLYFPYESVVGAFARARIDAMFDERTPDANFASRVKAYDALSETRRLEIAETLRDGNKLAVDEFSEALRMSLMRRITSVYVLTLHGAAQTLAGVAEAVAFIKSFDESIRVGPFVRYEVCVHYSNDDQIRGRFRDKTSAVAFLAAMK